MKRMLVLLLIVLQISLCGCSLAIDSVSADNIETLKGWSFQYNSGTNDYSLFFGLLNEHDEYVSAEVKVDIRIVNDRGEEVYFETQSVSKRDFGTYESQASGRRFLANVRISADDIRKGKSNNGTVYLTVYKDDTVRFDEVNCSALYCLPVAELQLTALDLPKAIEVKGYDGSTEGIIKVTEIEYSFDTDITPCLAITIIGEKVQGKANTGYEIICYKVYDSGGFLIETSNVYLHSLGIGDKFRDDSIMIYDVIPGEKYTIEFTEYSW